MNRIVKIPTTRILIIVPRFGAHLPYRNATIAVPTTTQVKTRPTRISPVVPSGLFSTKVLRVTIVVAASVPPTQIGLDSQYRMAVIEPGRRPNDILTHSYGPPSTGNAEPSSATSIPYGIRNTTSEISSQVIA